MFRQVLDLVVAALAMQCLVATPVAAAKKPVATKEPAAPELSYLYTAFVNCAGNLMSEKGPKGTRVAIPIVGGNFTGPRLNGKVLDLGADWGAADPRTKIFSADTRYNLRTDDGADILVQTSGPISPTGEMHLRVFLETGHKDYYWLNNIVAIGTLNAIEYHADSSVLKIDVWNFKSDWDTTIFLG